MIRSRATSYQVSTMTTQARQFWAQQAWARGWMPPPPWAGELTVPPVLLVAEDIGGWCFTDDELPCTAVRLGTGGGCAAADGPVGRSSERSSAPCRPSRPAAGEAPALLNAASRLLKTNSQRKQDRGALPLHYARTKLSFLHLRSIIHVRNFQRSRKIIFRVGERGRAKPFCSFRPQSEIFRSQHLDLQLDARRHNSLDQIATQAAIDLRGQGGGPRESGMWRHVAGVRRVANLTNNIAQLTSSI